MAQDEKSIPDLGIEIMLQQTQVETVKSYYNRFSYGLPFAIWQYVRKMNFLSSGKASDITAA